MNDYSEYIAIIGGGIAGLSLGCFLLRKDIQPIIFERSSQIREGGAGISISPNAINLLDKINLKESLSNEGFFPEKINFLDEDQPITSIDSRVCCISREKLVSILYKKFIDLGGRILFDHEYVSFDSGNKILNFKNDQSYKVLHLAACDGIKSKIRDDFFDKRKPVYSGYSAWRCIGQNPHKDAYLQLSSNKHLVLYPITNSLSSFVGCIKTSKENNESWIAEGSIDELVQDIGFMSDNHKETVHSSKKFFRWGIYTRPLLKKYFAKNITLFGDAAHPIVPFLGQGGCLAIEDGYSFAKLLSDIGNLEDTQNRYERIRKPRVKMITRLSKEQALHNHISNPLLKKTRNFLMSKTPIIDKQMDRIYKFNL